MNVFEMRQRVTPDDLSRLVERFYGRVRVDPLLAAVFDGRIPHDAWPAHLARMKDFWCTVLLGRGGYRGNPMLVHADVPDVTREHFTRWLSTFGEVLRELFEPPIADAIHGRARRMGANLVDALGV